MDTKGKAFKIGRIVSRPFLNRKYRTFYSAKKKNNEKTHFRNKRFFTRYFSRFVHLLQIVFTRRDARFNSTNTICRCSVNRGDIFCAIHTREFGRHSVRRIVHRSRRTRQSFSKRENHNESFAYEQLFDPLKSNSYLRACVCTNVDTYRVTAVRL
jgi:hypothetical protein